MLSASQPHFADFSSTSGLVFNGFGSDATTAGTNLSLTDLSNHEARSVWFSKKVPVDTFTSTFTFATSNSVASADGLTFTIQNSSTSAVGTDGSNLGYFGIKKSAATAFNIYNSSNYGSQFGFAQSGAYPLADRDMTPVDLHDGDSYTATIHYDGTTLTATVTSTTDSSKTFTASEPINLPKVLGTDKAYVGFTAATGAQFSPQQVVSWNYSGSNAPFIVNAAAAKPSPVNTGNTVGLSVLGGDAHGESTLTYAWSVVDMPANAKLPSFSANGTNGAKSIHAIFYKAGTYTFRCTIKNSLGLTTTSDVTVKVKSVASLVRLIPHIRIFHANEHVNFKAALVDQFGYPVASQPTFTYSIQEGSGTMNSKTGHYVASNNNGHVVIAASGGGFVGTVGGTLEN